EGGPPRRDRPPRKRGACCDGAAAPPRRGSGSRGGSPADSSRGRTAARGRCGQDREGDESGGEGREGSHRSTRPSPPPGGEGHFGRPPQAFICGQVLSIQVYVEVGSPFGQPGGAVMLRIGIVMMRVGSRIWNG